MFPTTVMVWTLQWNSSVLLCLWQFWSSVRWSGISQQRQKSQKSRGETFCLPSEVGGVLHGRTLYALHREARLKIKMIYILVVQSCVFLWIYTNVQQHTWRSRSEWMSGVTLHTASLKTTIVNLILAIEGMSENHQVPQDLSFGHQRYL